MANYNKQIEKWMTRASFDALDKSTIPEGTEINIVGDIQESDLSLELQNKINSCGHCFKLTFDLSGYWGIGSKGVVFVPTKSTDINDIANKLVADSVIGMDFYGTGNFNMGEDANAPYFGRLIKYINSASVNTTNKTINIGGGGIYIMTDQTKVETHNNTLDTYVEDFVYTATVEQIY